MRYLAACGGGFREQHHIRRASLESMPTDCTEIGELHRSEFSFDLQIGFHVSILNPTLDYVKRKWIPKIL
jgi:hypothetical protein